jgi:hypothetical protein
MPNQDGESFIPFKTNLSHPVVTGWERFCCLLIRPPWRPLLRIFPLITGVLVPHLDLPISRSFPHMFINKAYFFTRIKTPVFWVVSILMHRTMIKDIVRNECCFRAAM